MFKKKILCSAIALSMAATVVAPAVVTSNVIAAEAGTVDSNLLTSLMAKFNSAGLSLDEKAAIGLDASGYFNNNSNGVLESFFSGFTATEEQQIKNKFGFSKESLNAVISFVKSLSLTDLADLLSGKTSPDSKTTSLNTRLVAALKSAGVTDAQLSETIRYVAAVNNIGELSASVLLPDTNGKIKLGSDSSILALVDKLNALSSGVKIANTTNVKSALNTFVTEYNDPATSDIEKNGLLKLLQVNNIYPKPTTTTGGSTSGTTTPTTPTIEDTLKAVDTKDTAKVAAAQAAVDAEIAKAAKVTTAVDTTKATEAVLSVTKSDLQKAIDAVLAIEAKVNASTAKDAIKVETKVTIEAPAGITKDTVSAALTSELVDLLKTNKIDNLEVKVAGGVILIPVELLTLGKDVKLSVTKVATADAEKVASAASQAIGGKITPLAALDYSLFVGGEKLTTFSKPIVVTVAVEASAVKPDSTGVYFIGANASVQYIRNTYLNGVFTFNAKHFSQYAVLNYTKDFKDVAGNWIASTTYLQQGVKRLIAKGDTKGNFNPNKGITRAEFAAFIARTLQLETKAYQGSFSDVKATAWYAPEVEAVKAAGIVDGVGKGNFAPEKQITRQEMAKMIANAYSKVTGKSIKDIIGSSKTGFSDFDKVSSWAKDYVAALETLKVVEGSNGTYKPLDNSTRAESLKVIVELANKSAL